jgi:hypothetical protein
MKTSNVVRDSYEYNYSTSTTAANPGYANLQFSAYNASMGTRAPILCTVYRFCRIIKWEATIEPVCSQNSNGASYVSLVFAPGDETTAPTALADDESSKTWMMSLNSVAAANAHIRRTTPLKVAIGRDDLVEYPWYLTEQDPDDDELNVQGKLFIRSANTGTDVVVLHMACKITVEYKEPLDSNVVVERMINYLIDRDLLSSRKAKPADLLTALQAKPRMLRTLSRHMNLASLIAV